MLVTKLTAGGLGGTDPATASIQPDANALVVIGLSLGAFAGSLTAPASVTGNGITYQLIGNSGDYVSGAAEFRVYLYAGMSGNPTAGAITFAGTFDAASWGVFQATGLVAGSNGVNAYRNFATNFSQTAVSSLTVTLAAFASAANGAFGFLNGDVSAISAGSGWLDIYNDAAGEGSQAQWRPDNDITCDWTLTSNNGSAGVAIELIALATAATPTRRSPPGRTPGKQPPANTFKAGVASVITDVSIALTGIAMTPTAGSLTVTQAIALTGGNLTLTAGVSVPAVNCVLTGSILTGSAGALVPSNAIAVTGLASALSAGTLAPLTGTVLTGSATITAAGVLLPSLGVAVNSQSLTLAPGTLGVIGDITVALTGLDMVVNAGVLVANGADQPSNTLGPMGPYFPMSASIGYNKPKKRRMEPPEPVALEALDLPKLKRPTLTLAPKINVAALQAIAAQLETLQTTALAAGQMARLKQLADEEAEIMALLWLAL